MAQDRVLPPVLLKLDDSPNQADSKKDLPQSLRSISISENPKDKPVKTDEPLADAEKPDAPDNKSQKEASDKKMAFEIQKAQAQPFSFIPDSFEPAIAILLVALFLIGYSKGLFGRLKIN